MHHYFVEFSYLFASVFFIVGLKSLSHPDTARRGMHLAEIGMLLAIIGTLLHKEIVSYEWILVGLVVGGAIGGVLAQRVAMTALPQLTAALARIRRARRHARRHRGIRAARRAD